jgi:hypothetical protein
MTAAPATTATPNPLQQAVTFANVFTQAALDAAHHGISPDVIEVHRIGGVLSVGIHVGRRDKAAVDQLADLYGLAPDTGRPQNYTRDGHTVMAGDTVAVRVYCGRPLQVVPR